MNRFSLATFLLLITISGLFFGLGFSFSVGSYLSVGLAFFWVAFLWFRSFFMVVKNSADKKEAENIEQENGKRWLLPATIIVQLSVLLASIAGIMVVLPAAKVIAPWWTPLLLSSVSFFLLFSFFGYWKEKTSKNDSPLSLFRFLLWILLGIGGIQIAEQWKGWDWHTPFSLAIFATLSIFSSASLLSLWFLRKKETVLIWPSVVQWLFSRWNIFSSIFDQLERFFGIDIKGTWAIQFIRSAIEPLLVGMFGFAWLCTSLFVIQSDEQGVRENFGQPEETILEAGIHWKLPWPFGNIQTAPSRRLLEISIGHEEVATTTKTEKESILWANQHADEEFLLLLGDGHDLISADGLLQYRIVDVKAYLYHSQNPEELVRGIAYRVLMQETVSRTLEEALSENLQVLAKRVNTRIQEELEQWDIGVEAVIFSFSALHPPVSVAKEYQEVVSAQIERDTKILRAEGYLLQSLPRAEKEALTQLNQAKGFAAERRAAALGQSFQFEGLRVSIQKNKELFLFRRRQEALEQNLKGRDLLILDHRLEQDGAALWVQE